MEILGIGPLELLFILLIALVILGPNDMVKAGRTIGKTLNRLIRSSNWASIQRMAKEIKDLPASLMREAEMDDLLKELPKPENISKNLGLEDLKKEINTIHSDYAAWTNPEKIQLESEPESESTSEASPPASRSS